MREFWRGVGRVALALVVGCLAGGSARAQLTGQITLAKDTYMSGEPVYVHFEVTNAGATAVQYAASDPYNQACGSHRIEVSSGAALAHSNCARASDGECNPENEILAPGETKHELVLVNYNHDLSKTGKYEIRAAFTLRYTAVNASDTGREKKELKLEKRFAIQVTPGDRTMLEGIYRPYVANLQSRDDEIQREAERAIVGSAQPWLEDVIVGMLGRYTSREFALLGLKNLNTARSREELAKIVEKTAEFTPENELAVRYLGQMGDKKYFSLLRDLAVKGLPDEAKEYVLAAAELGGDDAVPFLREMLKSPDAAARANAVMGLGKTGSREAVALLMETLKSADANVGKLALCGLTELTHRTAGAEGDPPAEEFGVWRRWWEANGKSAEVYGPRMCGEVEGIR